MTVLFFSRLFYPHVGGVEKHVFEISKGLVKQKHNVVVVTELYDKKLSLREEYLGIEIYRIPISSKSWFKKFEIWKWMFQHRELIKKADVVHCHDVFFWYLPFRLLCITKPVFTTFHGYETKFPPTKRAIFVRKISERLSKGNICVGDYIEKWYGTSPDYVTYGGIKVHLGGVKKVLTGKAKLKILFIGRLEKDTGIPIYLESLDFLKKKSVNFSFKAIGDGSLKTEVEKYGQVRGFIKNVRLFIEKTDIVFASSYLSILEAMAAKRLVFSVYDNPLKRDYLKLSPFSQFIVIEDSAEKLAQQIEFYIHSSQKERMIENAYNWAKNQTWDDLTRTYLQLWNL